MPKYTAALSDILLNQFQQKLQALGSSYASYFTDDKKKIEAFKAGKLKGQEFLIRPSEQKGSIAVDFIDNKDRIWSRRFNLRDDGIIEVNRKNEIVEKYSSVGEFINHMRIFNQKAFGGYILPSGPARKPAPKEVQKIRATSSIPRITLKSTSGFVRPSASKWSKVDHFFASNKPAGKYVVAGKTSHLHLIAYKQKDEARKAVDNFNKACKDVSGSEITVKSGIISCDIILQAINMEPSDKIASFTLFNFF